MEPILRNISCISVRVCMCACTRIMNLIGQNVASNVRMLIIYICVLVQCKYTTKYRRGSGQRGSLTHAVGIIPNNI